MIPEDKRFLESHEWGHLEGDLLVVGLSDFAVKHLSDLVYIQLPEVGEKVEQGERFGEIESVKAVSDLNAPASGEIVEVNASVVDNLDLITNDCYGEGWFVKIKMDDASEFENLLSPEDYTAQIEKEEEEESLDDDGDDDDND
jgi:glycine cleavage system H protein